MKNIMIVVFAVTLILGIGTPLFAAAVSCQPPAGVDCGGDGFLFEDPESCSTNCGVWWCINVEWAWDGYYACAYNCQATIGNLNLDAYKSCLSGCDDLFNRECNSAHASYGSCESACGSWESDVIN